jgi:hypothetical protein
VKGRKETMAMHIQVENELHIGEQVYTMSWEDEEFSLATSTTSAKSAKAFKTIFENFFGRDNTIDLAVKQTAFKLQQLFVWQHGYPQFFTNEFLDGNKLQNDTWDISEAEIRGNARLFLLGAELHMFGKFLRGCLNVTYEILLVLKDNVELREKFETCFRIVLRLEDILREVIIPAHEVLSVQQAEVWRGILLRLLDCATIEAAKKIVGNLLSEQRSSSVMTIAHLANGLQAHYQNVLGYGTMSAYLMLKTHIDICWGAMNNAVPQSSVAASAAASTTGRPLYYAPYLALIQGSGTGKTKLAFELSSDYVLIYLCCRRHGSSGYPPRSPLANLFLTLHFNIRDGLTGEERFAVFFFVLFDELEKEVIKESSSVDLTGWSDQDKLKPLTQIIMSRDFAIQVENAFDAAILNPGTSVLQHCRITTQQLQAQPNLYEATRHKISVCKMTIRRCLALEKEYNFLFVIDEASAMLRGPSSDKVTHPPSADSFVIWRRSLNYIQSPDWFFLILDTISRVSNLHPPHEKDPSDRVVTGGHRLFPPFYAFAFTGKWSLPAATVNTMLDEKYQEKVECQPVTSQLFDSITYNTVRAHYEYSRPMFFIAAQTGEFPLLLAIGKLLNSCTSDLSTLSSAMSTSTNAGKWEMMAALCYRYHLRPCVPADKEELVASHMATLRGFSPIDNNMIVEYVPEPMIGEAAACCIQLRYRNDNQNMMFEDIKTLKTMIMNSQLARTFTVGDRGEFASNIYALHVLEKAQTVGGRAASIAPVQQPSMAIRAGDWIATIMETSMEALVASMNARNKESLRLLNGVMAFTGWYAAETDINREILVAGWLHRIAFMCQRNQEAMDAFIPLLLPVDNTTPEAKKVKLELIPQGQRISTTPVTKPHLVQILPPRSMMKEITMDANPGMASSIVLQVKNHTNDIYLSAALKYCILQCNNANKSLSCGVISVLHMVGTGRVITKKSKTGVESFPSALIRLDGYPKDLFLIINGYAGVEAAVQTILQDIAQEVVLRSMIEQSLTNQVANYKLQPNYVQSVLVNQQLSLTELEDEPDDSYQYTASSVVQSNLYVGEFSCGKSPILRGVLIRK